MKIKLGFFTGARSEYGIARSFLRNIDNDRKFDLSIFVNGMHLLKKFGYTASEIINDGFSIDSLIKTYTEDGDEKVFEFTNSVEKIYKTLLKKELDAIYIIGDRIEAYAAALAAHFLKIFIIHSGGGTITAGCVDNIYRNNITHLANLHLADSLKHYHQILRLKNDDKKNVCFVGSTSVDAIIKFKQKVVSITDVFPTIRPREFALMTFHPVTSIQEPIHKIMNACIKNIISCGFDILITYPNNDEGHIDIINVIDKWSEHENLFVSKSLGVESYYSALNDCAFLIGNSSSGVIEAPYFNKSILNIGKRQDGRDKDIGVIDVSAEINIVLKSIKKGFEQGWPTYECNYLYGDGNSVEKRKKAILESL